MTEKIMTVTINNKCPLYKILAFAIMWTRAVQNLL